MEHVTDETSNPFGMSAPCARAVYGYGDANADFHVVGDHPRAHGGVETGVPFTGAAGERIQGLLHELGFAAEPYSDAPDLEDCFLSYAHLCVPEERTNGEGSPEPADGDYADLERFLDAELRAINAHVLLPVGDRPLEYVLREHTTFAGKLPADAAALHARQLRGRGFLVVPVKDPADWTDGDREAIAETLRAVLDSDYRQTKGIPTLVG